MNEKFKELLSSLSPEMQEKAKACKNTQELNEFIADNDIELPEDALDMVAGGIQCDSVSKRCVNGEREHYWTHTGIKEGDKYRFECLKCDAVMYLNRRFLNG